MDDVSEREWAKERVANTGAAVIGWHAMRLMN